MKRLSAFFLTLLIPAIAFAAYNMRQKTDGTMCFQLNNSGTEPLCLSDDGGVDTSGTAYSTNVFGNPALLSTTQNIQTSEVNADYVILSSESSKTLYIHYITIMANGSASGATALVIEDTLGNDVASFPVAQLTDGTVVNYASSATMSGIFVSGLTTGRGLQISNTGSDLATTTDVTVNILYSVQ